MAPFSNINSLILAGGGNRCLWQTGLWDSIAKPLGLKPKIVAAASAGACMACSIFSGQNYSGLQAVKAAIAHNHKNFYPGRLLRGKNPLPHYRIYKNLLLGLFDHQALEKLKHGPEIRIVMARPPKGLGPVSAVFLGFLLYELEKHIKAPLHPTYASGAGFKMLVGKVADCRTPEELTGLILASSCTPPIIPIMRWRGGVALDGGLVDNVPVEAVAPEEGPALVLLSRRYDPDKLKGYPGRIYLQPSKDVPVGKWDYTSPAKMQESYDLGRKDGDALVKELLSQAVSS